MSNMKIKSSLRDYSVIFIDRLTEVGDALNDYNDKDCRVRAPLKFDGCFCCGLSGRTSDLTSFNKNNEIIRMISFLRKNCQNQ